jgi:hypothetical protein
MEDFRDGDEFEKLIREINRDNAHDAKRRRRASMKETYYWPRPFFEGREYRVLRMIFKRKIWDGDGKYVGIEEIVRRQPYEIA